MSEKTTMADLASQLGLNKSTVSRALQGDARVRQATRQRVLELAGRLGYRPDPALSALAQERWKREGRQSTRNLATLAVSPFRPLGGGTLEALAAPAAKLGYNLTSITIDMSTPPTVINRQLLSRGVRGVFLLPFSDLDLAKRYPWEAIDWERYCWVQVNECRMTYAVHRILYNAFQGVITALQTLFLLGFRRIALLREPSEWSRVNMRQQAAFLQFQATHADCATLELEKVAGSTDRSWSERVEAFAPEVLLLSYVWLHEQLSPQLKRLPWASLAVWAHDGEVAGIRLDHDHIAEESVDLLDYLIRRRQTGLPQRRKSVVLDGEWVGGRSLGKEFRPA